MMYVTTVKVKYKELLSNGIEAVMTKTFNSWDEEGSYSVFYDGSPTHGAVLFIPTINVITVEILKEIIHSEELNK